MSKRKEKASKQQDPVTRSDMLSNGFHGYKEGYEKLEKIGVTQRNRDFFNKIFVPVFLMVSTPNFVMLLWYTATKHKGSYGNMVHSITQASTLDSLRELWGDVHICSNFALSVVFGYCIWALLLMKCLPGKLVKGPITPKGNTPVYKDNGFSHYVVTMTTLFILTVILKKYNLSPSVVYDNFGDILGTLNVLSAIFCIFLYIKGLYSPSSTDCGSSGNIIFDYYWGTELYPRVLGFDIKVFTNCRFGMTIWAVLVYIYALKSYELHGFVDSMIVSAILQLAYITKFFWWEAGYLSTIDIMVDRAGYYICWGCLVYVPSLYASVSLYLVNNPVYLGRFWSTFILTCGLLSISVNYFADWQKQRVRSADGDCLIWGKKPNIIRAKYTLEDGQEKESILLTSGWWGLSRHFHYIPEILLALFWTLPAGFENFMPFSYVIFLTILLTHRSFRDDDKCSSKYGPFWMDYCERVPHRIVPYLF
ncbi:uncharacterized protein [Mytilus edulis]